MGTLLTSKATYPDPFFWELFFIIIIIFNNCKLEWILVLFYEECIRGSITFEYKMHIVVIILNIHGLLIHFLLIFYIWYLT